MRNILIYIAAAAITAAPAAAEPAAFEWRGSGGAIVVDAIIASIDGEPITLAELRRHAQAQGYAAQPGFPESSELTLDSPQLAEVLRDLVLTRLLDKEADAVGISVTKDEIDAYIAEIRRQNDVDEEQFVELLESRGLSWDKYVEQIRNDILKSRVVSARVRSKINVVDEDIERFLAERPELAPDVGSVRLQQIQFERAPGAGKDQLLDRAKELRAMLKRTPEPELPKAFARAGGDQFSDLGHMKVKDLRKDIRRAVKDLDAGDISEPVAVGQSVSLFLVAGKVTESQRVDSVLKEQIKDRIFQEKFQQQLRSFLDEELPKRYHVEFKL